MTEVLSAETIDPSELDKRQRQALVDKLYAIHRTVFAGLDQQAFDRYVVNSPAKKTRILLYRNRQKEPIGYFGVHRFETEVDGQPLVVFRGEVGLLPGYRQKDANLSFWWTEATKFKLLHPGKRVYFFFVPVSPSFYAMAVRYTHKAYPGRDLNIPADALRLLTQLAPQFGLPAVEEGKPLVRKVGWITLATQQEQAFWRTTRNPYVRFYIDANPKFGEGNGLLTLIPVTFANALLSLFGVGFHALKKKLRARRVQPKDDHSGRP
jgi:hypothetical protein